MRRLVYGDEHLDDRLGSITAPTLVAWGAGDTLTPPALGERIAGGIPGAKLVVFQDCAHSPNVEAPERFNDLLRDFLRQPRDVAAHRTALAAVG